MGTKARPFYRMVVAHSTQPRNGKFVEILGTYNPVAKPVHMSIAEDRALEWLLKGAQPSETAAVVLSRLGVLDRYFEQRPNAKKAYKFLDKRTAAMSVKSVIEAPAPAKPEAEEKPTETAAEAKPAEEVAAETPVAEASAEGTQAAEEAAAEVPAETEAPAGAEAASEELSTAESPAAETPAESPEAAEEKPE
jgi:small subunit ribosomal protein S16